MSVITGFDGSVTMPTGFSGKITAFTINVAVNQIDITGFTDSGWTNFVEGCKSATGSATGFLVTGSGASPFPTSGAFSGNIVLTAATGCTFSGPALITQIAVNRPTCQAASCTWNFSFMGRPTDTWA